MQLQDNIGTNENPQRCQGVTPAWCAVHTRYQHESSVHTLLSMKGFQTFYPTYKKIREWKDRKKEIAAPLFPGYVFVANAQQERLKVVSTPGVCAIVSIAGVPAVIPHHEIESIRRAIVGPYPLEPHVYLKKGDRVRIIRGPLTGIAGILVRKKGSLRLVVCVEMLGRAAAMEIDGASIEPLKHQAPPRTGPVIVPSLPATRELLV
jgi:transcription antitermination factor NusG